MAILAPVQRDTNNGVSIVRMHVSDTLSQVESANYITRNQSSINSLNSGVWQWYLTDIVLVAASDGNRFYYFTNNSFATLIPVSSGGGGTGDINGPSSATDDALARFDGTTGKLLQNSNVTLNDAGSMTFASDQNINMPGNSFINSNSFNGIAVQFKGASGTNVISLQPSESDALRITDGVAPSGYLTVDTTNQQLNFPVVGNYNDDLNIIGENTSINFEGIQFTTGTISATGTTVTFTAGVTNRFVGAYVTPGMGASFTPFHILTTDGVSTAQSSLSQTIASSSAFILTYQTLNNGGGFNNGMITQDAPYYQNLMGGWSGATFGTSDNPNFIFDCYGSALFPDGLMVGAQLTDRFNSLNITAHQSGGQITASAPIFTNNQDEGKIIAFAEGQTAVINSVFSSTVAFSNRSQTVSEQQFRIMGSSTGSGNDVCYMDWSGNLGCFDAYMRGTLKIGSLDVIGNGSGTITVYAALDIENLVTISQLQVLQGLDMEMSGIVNVTDPISAQDAATKNYVDTHSSFPTIATTASPSSNTATTGFGTSLTLGTSIQNTLGYDILVNISFIVTAAVGATIVMGVGSTSTPTTNTAVNTFSTTGVINLSAIVPNGYYLLVDKTGTLTSTNNTIAMPL